MVMDAVCIALAAHAAYFARYFIFGRPPIMSNEVFLASIILVMIVNNYAMGSQRLYGDQKPALITELLWPIFKAIVIDFAALSAAIVLFKQDTYSRIFLVTFIGFSFLFIIVQRIIAHYYLKHKSHYLPN